MKNPDYNELYWKTITTIARNRSRIAQVERKYPRTAKIPPRHNVKYVKIAVCQVLMPKLS